MEIEPRNIFFGGILSTFRGNMLEVERAVLTTCPVRATFTGTAFELFC